MLFEAIDSVPLSFCIVDKGVIIDCNLNAVNLFGYEKKSDLIGLKPFDLSPYLQDDNEESIIKGNEYIRRAQIEKNVNFTWRHSKKNGDTFLAYINLISIKNVLFALITNIDEAKEVEASIREKDEMYKLIFSHNKHMIYILDAKTLKITDANQATIDFYGYDIDTLKSLSYDDLFLHENGDLPKLIEEVLTNKRNFFFGKHRLANGEIRDVEIHIFAITLNNKEYLINMVYDTTEKIQQNIIINTFIQKSPYPIAVLDNTQRVLDINDKFTELFQYQKEDLLGKNLNDLLTTIEYRNELNKHIDKVFTENFIRVKTLRKRKDNSLINVEIVAFPITYNDKIIGAYVHYIDITQKIKDQNQLQVFKKVLENNNEGILITDTDGHIEWVNHAFTKITGYTLDEIMGNTPRILKSDIHDSTYYKNMWEHIYRDNHWHGEIWNKNKKGEIYPEWLNIYAIKNNNITTNYVGIFKDLSESKIIDQKMRILAQKDVLTGLYNRVYFTDKLNRIIQSKQNENIAVLFMDLNHFKEINDTLGHYAGDQFLVEISRRLQSSLDEQTIIARYGGDEFVVLLNNFKNKHQVTSQARKLLEQISRPYIYQGNYLLTSASLGIALYDKDGTTCDELIQNADIAMYVAKNSGMDKKIQYYTYKMRKDIDERFKIANLLRIALEKKAYTLLYEPIYNIHTDKIIGLELKIKWHNTQLESYSRNKYLNVAIKTGQINQIFDFMFDDICCRLSKSKNFKVPISINISIEQLEQSTFLHVIKEKMRKYHFDPTKIEFEFTDNNLNDSSSRASRTINELLKLGYNFTLDNFGQENSSIAQLKHYQIKKIKLATNLFKLNDDNKINYELIKLYRMISREMNILLIAKGISQDKQVALIKDLELDGCQGSYYSKPLTFNQINKLL